MAAAAHVFVTRHANDQALKNQVLIASSPSIPTASLLARERTGQHKANFYNMMFAFSKGKTFHRERRGTQRPPRLPLRIAEKRDFCGDLTRSPSFVFNELNRI
jgi:hypothetical protein